MKLILIIIVCLIITQYSCNQDYPAVKIPSEFHDDFELALGQEKSSVVDGKELRYVSSADIYIEKPLKNVFFDEITYIFNENTFKSNVLISVKMVKKFKKSELPIDSIAHNMIKICSRYFGENYKIGTTAPQWPLAIDYVTLYWHVDTIATVALHYTPYNISKRILEKESNNYTVQIAVMFGYYLDEYYPTEHYNRENLGLGELNHN